MLRVFAQLKPSPIHGLGVFAVKKIAKGTMVWEYDPRIDFQYSEIPVGWEWFTNHFGYKPLGKKYYEVSGDIAMFINHSYTPNICCAFEDYAIATRDIEKGEELTVDYREFDQDPESDGRLK